MKYGISCSRLKFWNKRYYGVISSFYGNHFYVKILPSLGESRKVCPRDQCKCCSRCSCVRVCVVCVQANSEPHVTNIDTFGLHSKLTLNNVFNDLSSFFMKISLYIILSLVANKMLPSVKRSNMWWTRARFFSVLPIFFRLKITRPFINKLWERTNKCFSKACQHKLYISN